MTLSLGGRGGCRGEVDRGHTEKNQTHKRKRRHVKKTLCEMAENCNIWFYRISCHLPTVFCFAALKVTSFTLHRWPIPLKIVARVLSASFIRVSRDCGRLWRHSFQCYLWCWLAGRAGMGREELLT